MLVWSIIQQGLPRFPDYYQHTWIPNALTTHAHSVSLSFSLSLRLSCIFLWLSFYELDNSIHSKIHHIHSALLCIKKILEVTLCNKNVTLKWKFGNSINDTPNSMRGWGSERHKKAYLIIFLITSVTKPKLFCTKSAGEYANRQSSNALAWAEEKSALWCFLVLNFKRKVKNISKNSLYNPRH